LGPERENPHRQRCTALLPDPYSEFETAGGGIWRICAVIDYATKYCLAARITPSTRPNAFSAWTT
jgi:putative transposase